MTEHETFNNCKNFIANVILSGTLPDSLDEECKKVYTEILTKINEYKEPNDGLNCINRSIYMVPEGKEKEFAERISMWAWEDRCRGYGTLKSSQILKFIKEKLRNDI